MFSVIRPCSPMAETNDLKSLQCGFESLLGQLWARTIHTHLQISWAKKLYSHHLWVDLIPSQRELWRSFPLTTDASRLAIHGLSWMTSRYWILMKRKYPAHPTVNQLASRCAELYCLTLLSKFLFLLSLIWLRKDSKSLGKHLPPNPLFSSKTAVCSAEMRSSSRIFSLNNL